jgi:UDP-glucose 4-epimerase
MEEWIMVTGGAGYIGGFTALEMVRGGRNILVADNLSTGHREVVDLLRGEAGPGRFAFEEIDLRDRGALSLVAAKYEIRGIVDFAALSLVGESQERPREYFENNVRAFLNLLEAFPETPVVKSSTAATYGEPDGEFIPLKESYQSLAVSEGLFPKSMLQAGAADFDTLIGWYRGEVEARAPWAALDEEDLALLRIPTNVYGITKVMDELMLKKRRLQRCSTYLSLRYFNAAGAEPQGLLGEDHSPETHLIPLVMRTALGLLASLIIHGDDYPTCDGTCIRDYISLKDLAAAHISGLDYLLGGGESHALNLGQGAGYSVREIIEAARRVTGLEIPAKVGPRRAGDPAVLIADPSFARQLLGWRSIETLDDIIKQAWDWHRTHPNGWAASPMITR